MHNNRHLKDFHTAFKFIKLEIFSLEITWVCHTVSFAPKPFWPLSTEAFSWGFSCVRDRLCAEFATTTCACIVLTWDANTTESPCWHTNQAKQHMRRAYSGSIKSMTITYTYCPRHWNCQPGHSEMNWHEMRKQDSMVCFFYIFSNEHLKGYIYIPQMHMPMM